MNQAHVNQAHVNQVSEKVASLGYQGIVKFDQEEPEYALFEKLSNTVGDEAHRALLGICLGKAD